MRSYLESYREPPFDTLKVRLVLYIEDAVRMDREQLAMLEDGLWLLEQSLHHYKTDGPLVSPNGLRVRT